MATSNGSPVLPNGPPVLTNGSPHEENQETFELVEALLESRLQGMEILMT